MLNDPVNLIDPWGLDSLEFFPDGPITYTPRGNPVTQGSLVLFGDDGTVKDSVPVNTGGYKSRDSLVEGNDTRMGPGNYQVSTSRLRSEGAFSRDGFGFSFNVDPEFDANQSLLRIHPDGSPRGTQACLGVDASGDRLRNFYNQVREAIRNNGGPIPLYVH